MKFYIQYDEQGNITGTVSSERMPEHPRQLEFYNHVHWMGKRVNLETQELENAPEEVE
jgi:hypothetical protein